jgi:predicted RNA-binding Zn-ribbon protein involved in translation (DUF1610 family)
MTRGIEKHCPDCNNLVSYAEKYDAYYCPTCNEWLEQKCSDPECTFCPNRPANPVEVTDETARTEETKK